YLWVGMPEDCWGASPWGPTTGSAGSRTAAIAAAGSVEGWWVVCSVVLTNWSYRCGVGTPGVADQPRLGPGVQAWSRLLGSSRNPRTPSPYHQFRCGPRCRP